MATRATEGAAGAAGAPRTPDDVDAALVASRALLGVVARSLAGALDKVSLPQFRVLVVLSASGPMRSGALAERMGINVSTFSRFVDRMVDGGWVERQPAAESRREVMIALTRAGSRLVDRVSRRRHEELGSILADLAPAERERIQNGLEAFARAAGEPPASDLLTLGL